MKLSKLQISSMIFFSFLLFSFGFNLNKNFISTLEEESFLSEKELKWTKTFPRRWAFVYLFDKIIVDELLLVLWVVRFHWAEVRWTKSLNSFRERTLAPFSLQQISSTNSSRTTKTFFFISTRTDRHLFFVFSCNIDLLSPFTWRLVHWLSWWKWSFVLEKNFKSNSMKMRGESRRSTVKTLLWKSIEDFQSIVQNYLFERELFRGENLLFFIVISHGQHRFLTIRFWTKKIPSAFLLWNRLIEINQTKWLLQQFSAEENREKSFSGISPSERSTPFAKIDEEEKRFSE